MNKKCLIMKKKRVLISTIVCVFVLVLTSCELTDHRGWGLFTPQKLFEKSFDIELPDDAKVLQYEWNDDNNWVMGIIEVTEEYARNLVSTMSTVFKNDASRLEEQYFLDYYNLSLRKDDIEFMTVFSFECSFNLLTVVNQHNGTMLIYLCHW